MPKINPERAIARRKNKAKYESKTPCKWGHTGERYTMTGGCCACAKEARDARYKATKVDDVLDEVIEGEFTSADDLVKALRGEPVTWGGPYERLMEAGWRV